jgi:5-(carboxyamino)imidazole ribonucleotide mutase
MNDLPLVSIIMGSDSDLKVMRGAAEICEQFAVPFEVAIVSAHRTPERMFAFARTAHERGIRTIIAGAGGAAHLPGMVAALTPLPVIGVPVPITALQGVDALYAIVQMPVGIPVATVAIGSARNAGLLAVQILATSDSSLQTKILDYRENLREQVEEKQKRLEAQGWQNYC